jgi:hypothetical protein
VNWCGLGGNVTYQPVILLDSGEGLLNHFSPLLLDQGAAIDWLGDRLAGRSAVSNCWTMPLQP